MHPIFNFRKGVVNIELYHHGIKGQKWGVRRYQNKDGTLTKAGKERLTYRNNIIRNDPYSDDVNKIVQRFQEILINFPRKGAKAMMKSATPRVGKNGDLEIFLNPIEYNVITKDTTSLRETLNAYINETVGKKVSISYFMIESGKRNNREDNDSVDFDSVISIPVSEVED